MVGTLNWKMLLRAATATAVIAILYVFLAQIGFLLAIAPGNVSPFWPAAGLAAAGVYLFGLRAAPGIWLGSFLTSMAATHDMAAMPTVAAMSAAIALGTTVQNLLLVYCLQRWLGPFPATPKPIHLAKLTGVAGLCSMVAATNGVASLLWAGFVIPQQMIVTWFAWWLGDVLGVLVMLPTVLVLYGWRQGKNVNRQAAAATGGLGIGLTMLVFLVLLRQEASYANAMLAAQAQFAGDGVQRTNRVEVGELDAAEGPNTDAAPNASFAENQRSALPWIALGIGLLLTALSAAYLKKRGDAEAAIRESQRQYQLLAETVSDVIWILDVASDRFRYVSPSVQRLRGFTPEEVSQNGFADSVTPAARTHLTAVLPARLTAFRQGATEVFVDEIEQLRRDGTTVMTETTTLYAVNEDNGRVEIYGVSRDITARKTAETALRQREAELARAQAVAHVGNYFWDRASDVATWSAELKRILGCEDREPSYALIVSLIHPDDAAQVKAAALVAQTEATFECEYRIVRPDGTIRWVRDHSDVLERNANGDMVRMFGTLQDITDHKVIDEARQRSEALYRVIFESSIEGIAAIDAQSFHFRYVNPAMCAMFGYSQDELRALDVSALHPPDAMARVYDQLRNAGNAAPVMVELLPCLRGDGHSFYANVTAAPVTIDQELHFIGFFTDLTARIQVEDALRASEERYRKLVEATPDAIQVFADGKVVFTNQAGATMFGAEHPDDLLGLPVLERVPAKYQGAVSGRLAEVGGGAPVTFLEQQLFRLDGSLVDVEVAGVPIIFAGQPAIQIIARDISERRQTERIQVAQYAASRVLAESPELSDALPRLLEIIGKGLEWQLVELWWYEEPTRTLSRRNTWLTSEQNNLASFTAPKRASTVAAGEGLVGEVWQSGGAIWLDDIGAYAVEPYVSLATTTGLRSAVGVPVVSDGEVIAVLVSYSTSNRPADARQLASLTDLGRQLGQFVGRKRAEAELKAERVSLARRVSERTIDLSRANAELARALQAKDEFLANMSHELRTPLTAILALSESLSELSRGPLNERQISAVTMIEQSGRHLLALINDILDLAKVEAGKLEIYPEAVDVYGLCRASLQFVQEMARKKEVQINLELATTTTLLVADPKRLKQILVNLLSNAVKFTPAGGGISLSIKRDAAARTIRFAVKDNGIGIAPDDIPRLFQPFVQLDASLSRQYEGTGLGLSLVQRLVVLHGGTIEVESDGIPGHGSCFTVTLPWHPELEEQRSAPETPGLAGQARLQDASLTAAEPAAVHDATILLADDNDVNVESVRDFLMSRGYKVVVARDGGEAVTVAREVNPDLILMDIQMPVLDGLDAMRRLRSEARFAATPIIALTALTMPGDAERCRAAGADDYMAKPMSLSALAQKIGVMLGRARRA